MLKLSPVLIWNINIFGGVITFGRSGLTLEVYLPLSVVKCHGMSRVQVYNQ